MDQNIVHSVTIKTEPETEEKNITLADFPFICRICLGRGELRFFEEEQCLWDLFVNLTKIEVHSTVDFPKNICIECITKLEDISLFIDVAKDTDFSFGKNVSFIKVEDESLLTIDGGYNNERTRYCCACFSSCNLSSFAEKITLLPIFQEITKIDVGANTKVRNVNSICSRCTNELEKASNFLSLSLSNNELLERLATADTKKEVPNTGDDGSFESITGINDLKVECTDEYTASDIKEEMLDDGLDRGSESSMEADENKPLHTSIDIKQDIIDNEEIIDTEPESSVNNWDQTEIHIKIDKKPKEFQQAEEKPFRCEYCGKGFSQKNHMKHHLLTHTGEKPFKCDYCDKKFSIKFNFERHLLFHTGVKPFKCHYCYKEYTLKYSLRSHLLTHTGERPFKCDHCEQSFIDKRRLQNHLFIHTGERPFKCGDCGESFRTRFILRNHSLSHTGVKPLECEYCCREFGRKYDLKTHLLTHTGEKPFKCDYCDKKFSIKSNFERHLLFHTGVKQFKCHYCYKEYTLKYSLRSHLLTHTGERPFKCDHCEQSFIDKRRLQNHLFIHTGERPFKCGDCGESFRAKFMLRNHSLSHIGVKPLECEYCCREFGRKHDLKNHLLTHTGEKPFKCDHCDKDFSIKSNLKRHLHSVHSTADFPENVCVECITKLEDISSFIDIARNTDFSSGKNVSFIEDEDEVSPTPKKPDEYNNERTRYCRACFSSSNLSSFEEKITLLQLFQEITSIDVGANTRIWKKTSICSKCTNELQKASRFKNLSISNSRFLERLAITDTKRELLTTNGDGNSGNVVVRNDLTDESTDNHTASDIKERISECGSERHSESNTETKGNEPLRTSIDIKEGIIEIDEHSSEDIPKEFQQTKGKPFRRDYCGRGFSQNRYMKDNLLTHTGENPFKCDICDKYISTKSSLKRHLLTHTGEKPFKCCHCDKAFVMKHHLNSHLLTHNPSRTHTGEKFICDICDKDFSFKSSLKRHVLTHRVEKPFECSHCDKRYAVKQSLNSHLVNHSGGTFKCGHCGKGFTKKSGMQKHVFIHHGVKPFDTN